MAKTYYWLQLTAGWLGDKRIKRLRKIPGGDTYTIIYLKMMLKSLENEGYLYYEDIEDDFASEVALDIDESVEAVEVTINYLMSKGLLEMVSPSEALLNDVPSMIGKETESAKKMRRLRAKQKQAALEDRSHCDHTVTKCDTEIEEDIEEELDKEIEEEKELDLIVSKDTIRQTDVQRVVEAWNAVGVSPVTRVTADSTRGKNLMARIRQFGIDEVLRAVENVKLSSFLQGQSSKGWVITFDWFVKPNNFIKVLEGQYTDNRSRQSSRISEVDNWG